MKKGKLRVIQISGVRGILSVVFVITCLCAGFIGFPSLVICRIWNYFAHGSYTIPEINLFQGMILYGILAVIYTILNSKHKFLVALEPKTISGAEMKNILKQARNQAMMQNYRDFEIQQPQIENNEAEEKPEDNEPIER